MIDISKLIGSDSEALILTVYYSLRAEISACHRALEVASAFLNLVALACSESSVSLGVHSVKKLFMSSSMRVPIAPQTSRSPVDVVSSVTSRNTLNPKLAVRYSKVKVKIFEKVG